MLVYVREISHGCLGEALVVLEFNGVHCEIIVSLFMMGLYLVCAQLEPGVALPPPEKLKRKIIIKDKLMRKKGESTSNFGTLQRGASINIESISEEGKKPPSEGTESPLPTLNGQFKL